MIYLSQIIIIAYTIASALQEIPVLKMAKDYVPHGNPYSQPFHFWGWIMTALVGVILALLQPSFGEGLLSLVFSSLWYWLLFDAYVSKQVHGTYFYVGTTSYVDKLLRKYLGNNAGKIKAAGCFALIVILNVLYQVL